MEVAPTNALYRLWRHRLVNPPPGPRPAAPLPAAPLDINVTLPLNRNWLFVRANVGEALYTGYLRVLNTLLLLAQVGREVC